MTGATPDQPDVLRDRASEAGLSVQQLDAVRDWLGELLVADRYAKLTQGGHAEDRIPLARVFLDLPFTQAEDSGVLDTLLHTKAWCRPEPSPSLGEDEHSREPAGYLLIGGPGQGKSTLTQFACQLHRARWLRPVVEQLPSAVQSVVAELDGAATQVREPWLPIRVELPSFVRWHAGEGTRPELEAHPSILRYVAARPGAKKSNLDVATLAALATTIPVLLVLDGFDEIGATTDRQLILEESRAILDWIARSNQAVMIVVATRPQGYGGELKQLGVPMRTLRLQALAPNRALAYGRTLAEAMMVGADARAQLLERLDRAMADEATLHLTTTPLQVTILLALLKQFGRAPRERWNLFKQYFDVIVAREIERESHASALLRDRRAEIIAIHRRVALSLHAESELAAHAPRMTRERLSQVIDAVLLEEGLDDDRRTELVVALADVAEQRLVFLVELEPGQLGFELRSLQEFMAAWALTEGREADVEARLRQIAQAPMFRNVLLFAASRFFCERSALRDIFDTQICPEIEAGDNVLARVARSGARIALDIVGEGSVASQPRIAKALTERAVAVLDLPPGDHVERLVDAAIGAGTDADVLRNAVERRMRAVGRSQDATLSAWYCIFIAAARDCEWAKQLGEEAWATFDHPATLLGAFQSWRRTEALSAWQFRMFARRADESMLDDLSRLGICDVRGRRISAFGLISQSRTKWLNHIFSFRGLDSGNLHLPVELAGVFSDVDAVLAFRNHPSASNLAAALRGCANTFSRRNFFELATWPLTACLEVAESESDLLRFAEDAESGLFGDVNDWRSAEASWSDRDVHLEAGGHPLAVGILSNGPPLAACYPMHEPGRKKDVARILPHLGRDVPAWVRWRALAVYLSKGRNSRQSMDDTELELLESALVAFPSMIEEILPRPSWLPVETWRRIIDKVEDLPWLGSSYFETYSTTPENKKLLNSVIMSIAFFRRGRKELGMIESIIPETLEGIRFERSICRALLGALKDTEVSGLVALAVERAEVEPRTWDLIIAMLRTGWLPAETQRALLLALREVIEPARTRAALFELMYNFVQRTTSELVSPAVWKRLALPLPYPEPIEAPQPVPEHPIVLESLHIENVRGLASLRIDLDLAEPNKGQWTMILGPNGVGKTTILRALVLALRNLREPGIWPKGAFAVPWRRDGVHEGSIRLALEGGHVQHTTIRGNGSESYVQAPDLDGPRLFPLFAYGARRGSALAGKQREVDLDTDAGPEVATLFDEGASLIHAETWLKELDGDAQKLGSSSQDVWPVVQAALCELLDVHAIEVRDFRVWVREAQGSPAIMLEAMSDGYLTTMGWFLDLVARWLRLLTSAGQLPTKDFLSTMRGLVLLDEIDLHLHPKWQVELLERTRRLLPQMSFIVTTHNPVTLIGARPEEVWVLSVEGGTVKARQGSEAPALLTIGQLYRRYFDIDQLRPHHIGQQLARYELLAGVAGRSDEQQEELEQLQKELRGTPYEPEWEPVPRKLVVEES